MPGWWFGPGEAGRGGADAYIFFCTSRAVS
jgi:hypothetical protein